MYACVAPSSPLPPLRVSGTLTSITLNWTAPLDTGGCPITGYKLYRNTGNLDPISIEVDPDSIRDDPTITEYEL